MKIYNKLFWLIFGMFGIAYASSGVSDVASLSLFGMGLILFVVILASFFATASSLPSVVCEIVIGMLIAFCYSYFGDLASLLANPVIQFIAEFGSILLLLEVGLETKIHQIKSVGYSAVVVAIIGVVLPTLSGVFIIAPYLFGINNTTYAIFIGATMAATSVGISVRVFKDLNMMNDISAKVVINAAIVDDVLGLLLLSIAISLFNIGSISLYGLLVIISGVVAYFVATFMIGLNILPRILAKLSCMVKINATHWLLFLLGSTLFLAYIAKLVGLASIIGAFVVGVVFSELPTQIRKFTHKIDLSEIEKLDHAIKPLSHVFIPIFFVYAGMQIDLSLFFSLKVVGLGIIISIIAIITKLLSGVFLGKKYQKLVVGAGMIPRGEVGLIFAITGKTLGIIDNQEFTILMFMIMLTSIVTPFLLKLARNYYLQKVN